MKKIIVVFLLSYIFTSSFCQKNYSLGIDGMLYNSITKNQNKQALFHKDFGLQIGFRKNINNYNFLCISVGGTNSDKNKFNLQLLRFGYEAGNLFNIKSWFVITEVALKNFRNINTNRNNLTIAPSIGIGYNLRICKHILFRTCNNFEYQVPNNIGRAFNNVSVGLVYSFTAIRKNTKNL